MPSIGPQSARAEPAMQPSGLTHKAAACALADQGNRAVATPLAPHLSAVILELRRPIREYVFSRFRRSENLQMETRFLHTFLTVVETSSLAETARRLNITSSAVVQRIKALEDEIGSALLFRSGHSMRPTPAGAAIIAGARGIVDAARNISSTAAGELDVGELRVGVINSALTGLLPSVLVSLKSNHPRIDLYILPGMSADLYSKLLTGDLDAAVMVKPHFKMPKTLEWMTIREEPLILLTSAKMAKADPRTILRREPFIRYDRNHWGGRLADHFLRKLKITPREQFELDSLEAISVMVGRGLGVSLIPDWPSPWPQGIRVRKISIPEAPVRQVGLIWPRMSPRVRLVQFLKDEIEKLAKRSARSA
jgi:DNA-binding transcriptional LysR family regulator